MFKYWVKLSGSPIRGEFPPKSYIMYTVWGCTNWNRPMFIYYRLSNDWFQTRISMRTKRYGTFLANSRKLVEIDPTVLPPANHRNTERWLAARTQFNTETNRDQVSLFPSIRLVARESSLLRILSQINPKYIYNYSGSDPCGWVWNN